jgi:hypothetical protein
VPSLAVPPRWHPGGPSWRVHRTPAWWLRQVTPLPAESLPGSAAAPFTLIRRSSAPVTATYSNDKYPKHLQANWRKVSPRSARGGGATPEVQLALWRAFRWPVKGPRGHRACTAQEARRRCRTCTACLIVVYSDFIGGAAALSALTAAFPWCRILAVAQTVLSASAATPRAPRLPQPPPARHLLGRKCRPSCPR